MPSTPHGPADAERAAPALVDARTVATRLGVSRAWVYENKRLLGGVALGTGKRPRLRFDLDAAVERATARLGSDASQRTETPEPSAISASRAPAARRRGPTTAPRRALRLQVRGRS